MVHRNQVFACVIKQYGTGLYRACVSLNKGHTIFLGAHPDEESADETISRFQDACQDGLIETAEDALSFVCALELTGFANRGWSRNEHELSLAA